MTILIIMIFKFLIIFKTIITIITCLFLQSLRPTNMWSNSSNSSIDRRFQTCFTFTGSYVAFTVYVLSYILLLPLFLLVLHVGFQSRRRRRSVATSHSDVLTFHMVLLELLGIVFTTLYYYAANTGKELQYVAVLMILPAIGTGQSLFHLLTCVDRYLAVVHPIRYVWLRQSAGIRLRNISIGCAWLLCCPPIGLYLLGIVYSRVYILVTLFSSVVLSFGTLCILCVVSRSGPGQASGAKQRADQTKQRALHTVAAITTALVVRFLFSMVPTTLSATLDLSGHHRCLLMTSAAWFSLPSSLVLPLLFLHRAGKLPDCKHDSEAA